MYKINRMAVFTINFVWIIIVGLFVAIGLGTYFLTNTSNNNNGPTTVCEVTPLRPGQCNTIGDVVNFYRDTEIPELGITRLFTDSNCTALATEVTTATTPESDPVNRSLLTVNTGILTNFVACLPECTEFNLLDGPCGFGTPATRYALVSNITGDPNTQLYTDSLCTVPDAGVGNYNDNTTQYSIPGFDGLVTSTSICI